MTISVMCNLISLRIVYWILLINVLRQIKVLQRFIQLLILKILFARIIRDIVQEQIMRTNFRIWSNVIEALRETIETLLISKFESTLKTHSIIWHVLIIIKWLIFVLYMSNELRFKSKICSWCKNWDISWRESKHRIERMTFIKIT